MTVPQECFIRCQLPQLGMYGIIIFIFQLCAKALLVEGDLKLASSVSTFEGLYRTTGLNGLIHDHVKHVQTVRADENAPFSDMLTSLLQNVCTHKSSDGQIFAPATGYAGVSVNVSTLHRKGKMWKGKWMWYLLV